MKDHMTPSTVESWYQFAKDRGRVLENGDIVVVYKCDKAPSWGIAAFSSTEGQTTSLIFEEMNRDHATYNWVCDGAANTQMKVGPSADENSDFPGVVHNQCIFLGALNARLSDRRWRELQKRLSTKVNESSHEGFHHPVSVEGSSKQPLPPAAPAESQKDFVSIAIRISIFQI